MNKQAKATRRMLKGTEAHLDYLILTTREQSALAIKPLVGAHPDHGVLFLTRVRVAMLPSASHNEKIKGKKWKGRGIRAIRCGRAACWLWPPG
jgi:hypothetical protein